MMKCRLFLQGVKIKSVVELNYIDSVSHETIRQVLKKMKLNLGSVKGG